MNGLGGVTGSRSRKVLWAICSIGLALAMAATVVLSGSAASNAKASAQARSVTQANTTIAGKLTAGLIQRGIPKDAYGGLLVAVQGRMVAGQDVERVRIWAPDGTLLFSTDRDDRVGSYRASGDQRLDAAIAGDTTSFSTPPSVPPKEGLAGSDERLYVTYVPLRLTAQEDVTAVVEVDHRLDALEASATRFLKLLQYAFLALLLVSLALLGLSLRAPARRKLGQAAPIRPVPRSGADEGRLRLIESALKEAESRASIAEGSAQALQQQVQALETQTAELELRAAAAEAQSSEAMERMKEAEGRLSEAVAANRALGGSAPSAEIAELEADLERYRSRALRTSELEAEIASLRAELAARPTASEATVDAAEATEILTRLQQAEAERDRTAGELQRLKAALADREAALALAREEAAGAAAGQPAGEQLRRLQEQLGAAEVRAREAEAQVLALRQDSGSAAAREQEARAAADAATARVSALEAEIERLRRELAEGAAASDETRREVERALAEAHEATRKAEQGVHDAEARATQSEARAEEAEARAAQAETRAAQAEALASRAEALAAHAEARAEGAEAGAGELDRLREQARAMGEILDASKAETIAARSERDAATSQVEAARGDVEAARAGAEAARANQAAAEAEIRALTARLEEVTTALQEAEAAPRDGGVSFGAGELGARVAELEGLRRQDISELQRVQQALANTQYELTEANRRAKEAEERLREFEGEGPVPKPLRKAPERPVGDGDELAAALETLTPPEWVADTSASDLDASPDGLGPDGQGMEIPDVPPEETISPSEEGLSLRERLTRAAAARHRISPAAPSEDEAKR